MLHEEEIRVCNGDVMMEDSKNCNETIVKKKFKVIVQGAVTQ